VRGLTAQAQAKLVAYDFPGNVRELRNVIENAMVSCQRDQIDARDLALLTNGQSSGTAQGVFDALIPISWGENALENLERQAIERAMMMTEGNRTKAAQMLGIRRSVLLRALVRHQLHIPSVTGRPPKQKDDPQFS
jgi:DNA-binding NtrC family response regulator